MWLLEYLKNYSALYLKSYLYKYRELNKVLKTIIENIWYCRIITFPAYLLWISKTEKQKVWFIKSKWIKNNLLS